MTSAGSILVDRARVCHHIAAERLGSCESFNSNFVIAPLSATGDDAVASISSVVVARAFSPVAVDE